MNKFLLFLLALTPLGFSNTRADVKMSALFGDHMVLQQEATVPVWGSGDPGENITVTFGDKKATATAGADGKWRADLPALPAGSAAGTLTVSGKNTLTFNDVLVGDVWICSGQSNMEYSAGRSQAADANDGQIRLFHVAHRIATEPVNDVHAVWTVCSMDTLPGFTSVGYYFAKSLRPVLKRPIGLVESSWGGTPAQAWTDLSALGTNPMLEHYIDGYKNIAATFPGGQTEVDAKMAAYAAADKEWSDKMNADATFQAALKTWSDAFAKAKAAGQPLLPRPLPPIPRPMGPVGPGVPTVLFNGMIDPLIPYAIKGVIWYQGESNAGSSTSGIEYGTLFPAMIAGWRTLWKEGDFPFLFVQIANYDYPVDSTGVPGSPFLRESQLKTLSLPKTGMAVIIDIGTPKNIHPPDKADVGARLALAARHVAYGENLVYTGPVFDSLKIESGKVRVTFKSDSVGGGLAIGTPPWVDPKAVPVSKTELQGFEIAGADEKWVGADAKIDGNAIVVSSPQMAEPAAVRYGWANAPVCNLSNKEGLPASPFRTDNWIEPASAPSPSPAPAKTPGK